MTRSTKLWFEIAAFAISFAALLATAALAIRMGAGLAMTTSMFTTFFVAFAAIAMGRRDVRRRDPARMSIKDELRLRKRRAQGARIQFR